MVFTLPRKPKLFCLFIYSDRCFCHIFTALLAISEFQRSIEIMDTLCQRCQTLILDDAAISGAHVRVNPDSGLEYLAINEEDGIDEIPTGYQWEDIVPDFPLLRKASEAACYCCQFLRETFVDTLNENFPRTPSAKVAITATYVWGVENHIKVARDEGTLERGLVALRFDMCLVHQSTPQFTVYFDIDSSVREW